MWLWTLREGPTASPSFPAICLHGGINLGQFPPCIAYLSRHESRVEVAAHTHTHTRTSSFQNRADNTAHRCEHTEIQIPSHMPPHIRRTCVRALQHTGTDPPRGECCQSNILSIEDFCPILSNWFPCCLLHLNPSIILPAESIGLI